MSALKNRVAFERAGGRVMQMVADVTKLEEIEAARPIEDQLGPIEPTEFANGPRTLRSW